MKNFPLLLLGVLAVAAGVFAFRSQRELSDLRRAAEAATVREAAQRDEKKQWQKTTEETARRIADLEKELAAVRSRGASGENSPGGSTGVAPSAPAPGADLLTSAMSLLDNPDMQRTMAARQRAALNARYGALFKSLHLDAATLAQFKDLLVEKQMVSSDVLSVVAKQGLNPLQNRQEVARLMASAQTEIDGKIKNLLGDDGYGEFQNYQRTQPQRALVTQLEQNLSFTDAPLTAAQSEQLVQVLSASTPPRPPNAPVSTRTTARISDEMIERASSVLSPVQLQALQEIRQQQQQAQQAALLLLQNQAPRPPLKENDSSAPVLPPSTK